MQIAWDIIAKTTKQIGSATISGQFCTFERRPRRQTVALNFILRTFESCGYSDTIYSLMNSPTELSCSLIGMVCAVIVKRNDRSLLINRITIPKQVRLVMLPVSGCHLASISARLLDGSSTLLLLAFVPSARTVSSGHTTLKRYL